MHNLIYNSDSKHYEEDFYNSYKPDQLKRVLIYWGNAVKNNKDKMWLCNELFIIMMLNLSLWLMNISVITLKGKSITLIGKYISNKAQKAIVLIWGTNVAKQGANVAIWGANLTCPIYYIHLELRIVDCRSGTGKGAGPL